MLMEKYHWTPQQIDEISKEKMEELMLLLNARLNIDAEVKWRVENKKDFTPENAKTIGGGIRKKVQL